MAEKTTYADWLKQDFGALIDKLPLDEIRKHFLRSFWLDQMLWMDGKAVQAQRWYYALRLTMTLGGVLLPALVGRPIPGWLTGVVSLLVAVSAAVEGLYRFGERWRHYRSTAEALKLEGWRYFQLSGPYQGAGTFAAAHGLFVARVSEMLEQEVRSYISTVAQEKKPPEGAAGEEGKAPGV